MNIEKLPSGNYRISQTKDGKRYRITVDHKPTKTEATNLIYEKIHSSPTCSYKGTFKQAAQGYIDIKENVLSPKTIKEYSGTIQRLPQWFVNLSFADITQKEIQSCVNEMARKLSPKTVKNRYGFITAIIGFYNPSLNISATLPKSHRNEPVIPVDEDVKRIMEYVKEKRPVYYVPLVLGAYGLRRSEICALTADDIDGNVAHISKALVQDKDNNWVIKTTKTITSTRAVIIPHEIASMIKSQGYAYKGHPGQISKNLQAVQKELGIEKFSLHKLRHYFASKMLEITDQKTVQEMGGWKGNETIMRVYQHSLTMKNEKKLQDISKKFGDSFL